MALDLEVELAAAQANTRRLFREGVRESEALLAAATSEWARDYATRLLESDRARLAALLRDHAESHARCGPECAAGPDALMS
jgi:hypothetical protein